MTQVTKGTYEDTEVSGKENSMKKAALFLADGCEEIEALTQVDLLRRAGIQVDTISISDKKTIHGSHDIIFEADMLIKDMDEDGYDAIILPGGGVGTQNLKASDRVISIVQKYAASGRLTTAICAAPTVLGQAGVLKGKHATCYPGCESGLTGAITSTESVVTDGNIVTSRGVGTAIDFGLKIIELLISKTKAEEISNSVVYICCRRLT